MDRDSIVKESPMVFIRSMNVETFHIHLTDNAKPFCVSTLLSIPYAYRDKLASELELLQLQNIIAHVTEVTDWCAL